MSFLSAPKETPDSLIKLIRGQINWMLEKKSQMIPSMQIIKEKGFKLISQLNPLAKHSAFYEKLLSENSVDLESFLDKCKQFQKKTEEQRDKPFMDEFFKVLNKYNKSFTALEKMTEELDSKSGYKPPKLK